MYDALVDADIARAQALTVKRLFSRSIDGHADVREFCPRAAYLPFLPHASPHGTVAVQPDRSELLDARFPFLVDGVPLASWLSAVAAFVPKGSARWMREKTRAGVVFVQQWHHAGSVRAARA